METQDPQQEEIPLPAPKPEPVKPYVYTIRDWKEYLGESLLIIFSVLLALILTEFFNNLHEKENTKNILKSIVSELRRNKTALEEMKQYNLRVLRNIDSALVNKSVQEKLVADDAFHLNLIAPEGVLFRDFEEEAWAFARSNNIASKIDGATFARLSKLYIDQQKIYKLEDEVAGVIFGRASRDPKQVHLTLMIIRDIYHGWAVDRTDGLLKQMDSAIIKTAL